MRERRSLVVALHDGDGHTSATASRRRSSCRSTPRRRSAGARDLLERVLMPRVVGREFDAAEAVDAALQRRRARQPLRARGARDRGVGSRGAPPRHRARRAARRSGWASPPAADDSLRRRARHSGGPVARHPRAGSPTRCAQGYRRVKIKVAPGWDVLPVRAAREAMAGTGLPLTVDANGAYEWPEHEASLRALDDAGLLYIEQPLAAGRARRPRRALRQQLRTPICVDETLRDARAARQVAELDGPRVWNVKVHRVGGLTEVLPHLARSPTRSALRLWAGTMPESGLGSQAALAAAALPGFVYPVRSRAQRAVVRPERRRHQAGDGPDGRWRCRTSRSRGRLDQSRCSAGASRLLHYVTTWSNTRSSSPAPRSEALPERSEPGRRTR